MLKTRKYQYKKIFSLKLATSIKEEIKNLPVQSLNDIVNLQAGVVDGHFRGGRLGEVQYQLDGVTINPTIILAIQNFGEIHIALIQPDATDPNKFLEQVTWANATGSTAGMPKCLKIE